MQTFRGMHETYFVCGKGISELHCAIFFFNELQSFALLHEGGRGLSMAYYALLVIMPSWGFLCDVCVVTVSSTLHAWSRDSVLRLEPQIISADWVASPSLACRYLI